MTRVSSVHETLHQMVDTLDEGEARRFISLITHRERLLDDHMLLALLLAPYDDEPTTPEEDEGAREAWQEYLDGKGISAEEAKRELLG